MINTDRKLAEIGMIWQKENTEHEMASELNYLFNKRIEQGKEEIDPKRIFDNIFRQEGYLKLVNPQLFNETMGMKDLNKFFYQPEILEIWKFKYYFLPLGESKVEVQTATYEVIRLMERNLMFKESSKKLLYPAYKLKEKFQKQQAEEEFYRILYKQMQDFEQNLKQCKLPDFLEQEVYPMLRKDLEIWKKQKLEALAAESYSTECV